MIIQRIAHTDFVLRMKSKIGVAKDIDQKKINLIGVQLILKQFPLNKGELFFNFNQLNTS